MKGPLTKTGLAGNSEDFGQEIKWSGIFKNEQQPVGEVKEKRGEGGGPRREEERGLMGNYLFQAEGTE